MPPNQYGVKWKNPRYYAIVLVIQFKKRWEKIISFYDIPQPDQPDFKTLRVLIRNFHVMDKSPEVSDTDT